MNEKQKEYLTTLAKISWGVFLSAVAGGKIIGEAPRISQIIAIICVASIIIVAEYTFKRNKNGLLLDYNIYWRDGGTLNMECDTL